MTTPNNANDEPVRQGMPYPVGVFFSDQRPLESFQPTVLPASQNTDLVALSQEYALFLPNVLYSPYGFGRDPFVEFARDLGREPECFIVQLALPCPPVVIGFTKLFGEQFMPCDWRIFAMRPPEARQFLRWVGTVAAVEPSNPQMAVRYRLQEVTISDSLRAGRELGWGSPAIGRLQVPAVVVEGQQILAYQPHRPQKAPWLDLPRLAWLPNEPQHVAALQQFTTHFLQGTSDVYRAEQIVEAWPSEDQGLSLDPALSPERRAD